MITIILLIKQKQKAKVDRLRKEFLQNMPFKLRTAINSIVGFATLLSNEKEDPLPIELKEYVDNLLLGSNDVIKMMKEISDHAGETSGRSFTVLSFELRTALNNILGFAELIKTFKMNQLSVPQKGYIENILSGGNEILQLINDMPDLAEIEYGPVKIAMKKQTLTELAFELRTSTNAMMGFAEILRSGQMGPLSMDQKEYISNILSGTNEMIQLIETISTLIVHESSREGIAMEHTFYTMMSFKLRTALNNIIGFSTLVHDGNIGQLTTEQKACLQHILASSNHAMQLIPIKD